MPHWPDTRLIHRLGIAHPILRAPMAGAAGPELTIAAVRVLPPAALTRRLAAPALDRLRASGA